MPENLPSTNYTEPRVFKISERQEELLNALSSKGQHLGDFYYGALLVLDDERNPERFRHAAHSFRELIEKLPLLQKSKTLKQAVDSLKNKWEGVFDKTVDYTSYYVTTHDKDVIKMLTHLKEFFEWFEQDLPNRKITISGLLTSLENHKRKLPECIQKLRVDELFEYNKFFLSAAHGVTKVDSKEFQKYQSAFEGFLLDYLRPRPYQDQKILEDIIKEGEKND